MRAVVQRVRWARVRVGDDVAAEIDRAGLVVLVGVTHDDSAANAQALATKLHGLRILDGERSISDVGAPVIVVSQFTLYADTRKGRRPSWNAAAPRAVAEPLVEEVVRAFQDLGTDVQAGVFGADMLVELANDGPVTLIVEV